MAANQQPTATEVCFLGREAIELDADRSIEVESGSLWYQPFEVSTVVVDSDRTRPDKSVRCDTVLF